MKELLKCSFIALFFLVLPALAWCQNKTITYTESKEDFSNPERGFYLPTGTRASHFVPLDGEKIKAYRLKPQKPGRASYSVEASLILRGYELDSFKDRPLSDSFLTDLQKDFDEVREAGLKMILRFAYINKTHAGDCGDQYHICPPYGDAPEAIVLTHIQQLKPLFQKNEDVIAVLQMGFIGIWGENFYTDYFGDASANGPGKIMDSSWVHRKEVLKALLEALPADRMIQVRTPQIKQKYVYGPSAAVTSAPLQESEAFSESDKARIGFHNDCFLASADDYGTYYDYGSSAQPKQPATEPLRKYIEADTRFTVVGGETCDDAFSPQNDCAPAGYAEEEIRQMHYSFLNSAYNTSVNNDWDSGGCLDNIKRKLGYRFVLRKAQFPQKVGRAGSLNCRLFLDNIGYASPYNPRPVEMIFRNIVTGKEFMAALKLKPQLLFPGSHQIPLVIQMPAGITPGAYELYLFLPDAGSSISKRPEYAIRLANENMWEESTGYNDLHQELQVK